MEKDDELLYPELFDEKRSRTADDGVQRVKVARYGPGIDREGANEEFLEKSLEKWYAWESQ